jgi:hypothetical protein
MSTPLFGEWLRGPVKGTALRLVIEEMSARAEAPSAAAVKVSVSPELPGQCVVSSGTASWPWRGESSDLSPSITWTYAEEVEFRSLRVTQTNEKEWIRRYRIEVMRDGQTWTIAVPSCLLDSYHVQPSRLTNQVKELSSSLLPPGRGTEWVQTFFEDYLLKTIEPLGPASPYPDWLSGEYFLAAAVRPFGFGGCYNAGDGGNFDALITAICSPEMAIEGQKLFPDLIHHFGVMPSVMDPGHKDDKAFGLDITSHAWGPCCYWDLFAWSRDRKFLAWFADACAKWARWWLANRDRNHDGWLEPGPNAC